MSLVQTTTRRSLGEWNVTAWATIERASARASSPEPSSSASSGPLTESAAKRRSATCTGRSGTTAWVSMKRRSATELSGSRSSTGAVSAATSDVARYRAPDATRTTPKSASVARRSHRRRLSTTAHSACGSGAFHSSASRCAFAVFRTSVRVRSRYRRYSRRSLRMVVLALVRCRTSEAMTMAMQEIRNTPPTM